MYAEHIRYLIPLHEVVYYEEKKITVLIFLAYSLSLAACSHSSKSDNSTSNIVESKTSNSIVVESDSTFTNENSKNQTNKMTLDELRVIIQEAKAKEDPRQTISYIRNEIRKINPKKITNKYGLECLTCDITDTSDSNNGRVEVEGTLGPGVVWYYKCDENGNDIGEELLYSNYSEMTKNYPTLDQVQEIITRSETEAARQNYVSQAKFIHDELCKIQPECGDICISTEDPSLDQDRMKQRPCDSFLIKSNSDETINQVLLVVPDPIPDYIGGEYDGDVLMFLEERDLHFNVLSRTVLYQT